jgi:hypothetical protein
MICWFNNHGNAVRYSKEFVYYIYNYNGAGFHMQDKNMREGISLFMARCFTKQNWINDADVYLPPSVKKRRG